MKDPMYRLVAISGRWKGRAWSFGSKGFTLGRDAGCEIRITDPTISRRQCRVFVEDQEVHFEELGGANPVLINGIPQTNAVLKPGSVIALGKWQFLVSAEMEAEMEQNTADDASLVTKSWAKGEPVTLEIDSARPDAHPRPSTIQDFLFLYDLGRALSEADSISKLTQILAEGLHRRFHPRSLWIALVHDESQIRMIHEETAKESVAPQQWMNRALEEGCGILAPEVKKSGSGRMLTLTLAAPLAAHGANVGAVALQTSVPHGAYDEDDLRMLALIARTAAPLMCSVQHAEHLERENVRLRAQAGESGTLVGESRAMGSVRHQITKAAKTNLSVLITGETGTGKELAARMLHAHSGRCNGPLVVVNCAAIPKDLFESEFFGYEKGAFTGATESRTGLLEQAHGGTLFLDEIGDLSLDNQARILRCIEGGAFRRVGGRSEIQVDVRFLAATNKDIAEAIREGAFRNDLYHRLNAVEIYLPPLRERPSDIEVLALHFFELFRTQAKHPLLGFTPEALKHLRGRKWPGNARELRNCIQRAVAMAKKQITVADLFGQAHREEASEGNSEAHTLLEAEKRHIALVLRWCGGDVEEAARILQIGYSTLRRKISEYHLK
ncbi:MAG TPA: sigma 54-interacting transcriptional regulator [Candidatus Hydrogenedentes bacterium]|nr:sigma 54-interacting transcriptional regulator [Candidatus Hydrogenedentota bacterium]